MQHSKNTSDKIHIATIGAPFGVRGHFRLKVFTEHPGDALAYGPLSDEKGKIYAFNLIRTENPNTLVVSEPSIKDRTMAERIRGIKLYIDEANLPDVEDDDTFYGSDLIDLKVVDEHGNTLGSVTNLVNYGASDILEVLTPEGKKQIPFIKDAILDVDFDKGIITIYPAFLI